MSRTYFFPPTGKVIIAPAKRSAWLASNSIWQQAKVYTAKPLVGVGTHLNRDEVLFAGEGCAKRAASRRRTTSNCCAALLGCGGAGWARMRIHRIASELMLDLGSSSKRGSC